MLAPVRHHHGHHVSLTHLDDIKSLQAEVAKHQQLDFGTPRISISAASQHPHSRTVPRSLQFTASSGPQRPQSSTRLLPAVWNPVFLDKPPQYKRYLICHPDMFPVCSLHLAAICIQRWWRSMPRERRTMRSSRRLQSLPSWEHPWHRLKKLKLRTTAGQHKTPMLLKGGKTTSAAAAARLAEGGGLLALASPSTVSFADHCARVIQRAWRASVERRHRLYVKRRLYRVAARSIQRWWQAMLERRRDRRSRHSRAAVVIQRAFRRHADRRVYRFFRDLVRSRERTEPQLLLKALQAREAALTDASSGLYVRLRLGGSAFPPLILYKVFTSQRVLDVGSFAPRQYALDSRRDDGCTDVSAWYRREERNGWRVVGSSSLMMREEEEEREREQRRQAVSYHHPNRQVRTVERERRRKQRRVDWLKRMYRSGQQQEEQRRQQQQQEAKEPQPGCSTMTDVYEVTVRMDELIGRGREEREQEDSAAQRPHRDDWEDDAQLLVDWAAELNFDAYQMQWSSRGVTLPAVKQR